MNMAPALELLVFMSVAPVLFFFMAPASVPFHTLIFQLSWCASSSVENELNHVHKIKRIHQTYLSNLISDKKHSHSSLEIGWSIRKFC